MVKNVGYIFSEKLISISNLLPVHKERSTFIHELISSYELFQKMEIIEPTPATKKEILTYHSKEYIEHFENQQEEEEEGEEIFENIFEYIQFIAGSTLTACRKLIQSEMNICINWEV
jgi:histone deacetylase 1/2